ncbi:hypothetical protein LTR51_008640 [Lithohypha guttulata]|nr:hypothetical protein LTR51_008640 [Lithohypha guttulata]
MSDFCADSVPAHSVEEDDSQSYSRGSPAGFGQWTQYSDILDVPTPGLYSDSPGVHHWSPSRSIASPVPQPYALGFISLQNWRSDHVYNEVPPLYLHYNVEWKVKVNKTIIFKETEENIVLSPAAFWEQVLQTRLDEQLQKDNRSSRSVCAKVTDIVVSVTGRSERPWVKQFGGTNIDWSKVERKLLEWSELFRKGKRLRVDICLQYVEKETSARSINPQQKRRKVGGSATQRLMAQRDAEIDAEESSTGQPSAWRHVYAKMRCPGPPCTLEPYCWQDSRTNKRYKLKSHHLRVLIRHYQDGRPLETHDDVPDELRQQIYLEEEQSSRNKRLNTTTAPASMPPIQLVLPKAASPGPEVDRKPEVKRIDIPGLHDVNLQHYCDWLKSRVRSATLKAEYQKATDFLIEYGYDLDLLHEDQDHTFLTEKGEVMPGTARRYIKDIAYWTALRGTEEESASSLD